MKSCGTSVIISVTPNKPSSVGRGSGSGNSILK